MGTAALQRKNDPDPSGQTKRKLPLPISEHLPINDAMTHAADKSTLLPLSAAALRASLLLLIRL
ncbi:hypothetical protein Z946_2143 [Sulfitobacter noctilucicola]|nr:hypothetical protein Z946_2143 [Sulfitobacter noctilucicola]